METGDMERLMAILQAHALAICALISSHPQPDRLRRDIAALDEKTQMKMGQEAWFLYRGTLATFLKSLSK